MSLSVTEKESEDGHPHSINIVGEATIYDAEVLYENLSKLKISSDNVDINLNDLDELDTSAAQIIWTFASSLKSEGLDVYVKNANSKTSDQFRLLGMSRLLQ